MNSDFIQNYYIKGDRTCDNLKGEEVKDKSGSDSQNWTEGG